MAKKRIAVLGATGSIGSSTLDVLSRATDDFEVVLLSANKNSVKLAELKTKWPNAALSLAGKELLAAIADAGADLTVNGISGAAGLEPSMAAIESGSSLALANKETIVMAGPLVLKRAKEKNVSVIPVDSEHSAVLHLTAAHGMDHIDEIILTASGGPFRNLSRSMMKHVRAAEALAHPTWDMGPKITIDSASLANKGLEVIEAVHFFNVPPEKIKVVLNPQSIVHSMIRTKDGSVYASLARPDMRFPIQQALYWPDIVSSGFAPLDFTSLRIEFSLPDTERFPMLPLAYGAIKQGGFYPCAYNSANEEVVLAFLENKIHFMDIPEITKNVLNMDWGGNPDGVDSILSVHKRAGEAAKAYIESIKE